MFHDIDSKAHQGKVVVLFSGGQDSTTCLMQAEAMWGRENVYPLSFAYGQRHSIEVVCAERIVTQLDMHDQWTVLPVEALAALGGSALTDEDVPVAANAVGSGNAFAAARGLPSTFVPGRNMLFLTLAAAYAAKIGAPNIVIGVCQADRSGYPDCRGPFIEAAEMALREALDDMTLTLYAPLLYRTKAETFALAEDLGCIKLIVNETNTCYNGDREQLHEWGYGCNDCPACEERAKGWDEFIEAQAAESH